ncbi:twin-arginine translocation signal domain-containing protein [Pseudonocardia bannensis]|uniref:Twin-arginine translocation signal domain-containing protein n=1 Tax=Pseudonocardia bannensis TaxID=630973 RepID=A0A848DAA0_9PSEU|nr:twin-arginine translocation signal domain-containing protein [Pseudonocardia bannensis]NMH90193.1 twin-arginine translocation signal domain-containing protein [Pseudonocardia bannensis]
MGPGEDTAPSRRSLLRAGAAAGLVVAAGSGSPAVPSPDPPAPASARPARSPDPAAVRTGPASEADHARSGRPEVARTSHGAGDLDGATDYPVVLSTTSTPGTSAAPAPRPFGTTSPRPDPAAW